MLEIDLTREINKAFTLYSRNVKKEIIESANEAGKLGLKSLRRIGGYNDRTGKYRKSFRLKKKDEHLKYNVTIHANEQNWRLTHLLEYGHMTKDGTSRTKAYPHWETTQEYTIINFENILYRKLQEVGI